MCRPCFSLINVLRYEGCSTEPLLLSIRVGESSAFLPTAMQPFVRGFPRIRYCTNAFIISWLHMKELFDWHSEWGATQQADAAIDNRVWRVPPSINISLQHPLHCSIFSWVQPLPAPPQGQVLAAIPGMQYIVFNVAWKFHRNGVSPILSLIYERYFLQSFELVLTLNVLSDSIMALVEVISIDFPRGYREICSSVRTLKNGWAMAYPAQPPSIHQDLKFLVPRLAAFRGEKGQALAFICVRLAIKILTWDLWDNNSKMYLKSSIEISLLLSAALSHMEARAPLHCCQPSLSHYTMLENHATSFCSKYAITSPCL